MESCSTSQKRFSCVSHLLHTLSHGDSSFAAITAWITELGQLLISGDEAAESPFSDLSSVELVYVTLRVLQLGLHRLPD